MIYKAARKGPVCKACYHVTGIDTSFPAGPAGYTAALKAGEKRWIETMLRTELVQAGRVVNYWDTETEHESLF